MSSLKSRGITLFFVSHKSFSAEIKLNLSSILFYVCERTRANVKRSPPGCVNGKQRHLAALVAHVEWSVSRVSLQGIIVNTDKTNSCFWEFLTIIGKPVKTGNLIIDKQWPNVAITNIHHSMTALLQYPYLKRSWNDGVSLAAFSSKTSFLGKKTRMDKANGIQ